MKPPDLTTFMFIPMIWVFARIFLSFIQISDSDFMSPRGPPDISVVAFQWADSNAWACRTAPLASAARTSPAAFDKSDFTIAPFGFRRQRASRSGLKQNGRGFHSTR